MWLLMEFPAVVSGTSNSMDRILHLLPAFDIGGAERALARLLAGGLASGFENHVASMSGDGAMSDVFRRSGAIVHLLGTRGRAFLPTELIALGRRLRPAIFQGWMYHANFLATLLEPAIRPAAVLWNIRQGLDDMGGDKFVTRQMIRAGRMLSGRPAHIIYNSHQSAREHQAYGYRSDKTVVIPNGFECGTVKPSPAIGERYRERYGVSPSAPLFVHAARFHPMKDHALFIAAADLVLNHEPNARFIMMGRGVERQADVLLAPVEPSRHARFTILDERNDVIEFLQAADALVVSSRRAEGFPNVIGEAMMAATPVIATDTGDCSEILGDAGIIIPKSDARALADAMLRYARDREHAAEVGRRSRLRVESVFTIERAAASYAALYRNLLNGVPKSCAA